MHSEECEIKKINFLNKLDKFRADKNNKNRLEMVKSRSEYKTAVRKFKYNIRKQNTEMLIVSKEKNAREYWKLLKQSQIKSNSQSLSAQNFYEYFKNNK